jgi:hypothetical protein
MKTCENPQCRAEYAPLRDRQKYCTQNCADQEKRSVDIGRLCLLVEAGETKVEMSRQLGVSYTTIRRAITEYGLEAAWRKQRFA